MSETSEVREIKGKRVFVSYSRADRQRVEGLVGLLEALDHSVFMDQRSLRPGRQWKIELEKQLGAADVLLVFWTRHAAQSAWVRRELLDFRADDRDRDVVPVLGDSTPLPPELETRQHSDFCPLINELLATVRDLEDKGVSKRQIRAVVVKRLDEEGIKLPSKKLSRFFALFGMFGLLTAPLYFVRLGGDVLADKTAALPVSYYYTAGAAAAAGILTCHTLPTIGDGTADRISAPDTYPVTISAGQSGSDACDAQGMICVSVSRTGIRDKNDRFFGYSTPTCAAQVMRASNRESWCPRDFGSNFVMRGVVLRRSPQADEGVEDFSGQDLFCLGDEPGKQGIYEFANCVKP